MTGELDTANRPLATALQAGIALDLARHIAGDRGEHKSREDVLVLPNIVVPDEVAFHFGEPSLDAIGVHHSARIEVNTKGHDRKPITSGHFANLYFLQHEDLGNGRSFITRVGYHLDSGDNSYLQWLQRTVYAEHGQPKKERTQAGLGRLSITNTPFGITVEDMKNMRNRLNANEQNYKASGLGVVYVGEAADIIGFFRSIAKE